jgi:hypothetical protein
MSVLRKFVSLAALGAALSLVVSPEAQAARIRAFQAGGSAFTQQARFVSLLLTQQAQAITYQSEIAQKQNNAIVQQIALLNSFQTPSVQRRIAQSQALVFRYQLTLSGGKVNMNNRLNTINSLLNSLSMFQPTNPVQSAQFSFFLSAQYQRSDRLTLATQQLISRPPATPFMAAGPANAFGLL